MPCFAYVGAEDNRKGIPFVKIVSLLCKLIQFLMVALSVTVHKALILLVFLNHPYQSLAFTGLFDDCRNTSRTNSTSTFTLFEYHFSIYFLCFLWLKSAYFRWISQSYLYLHDFLAPFWHRILLLTKLKVSPYLVKTCLQYLVHPHFGQVNFLLVIVWGPIT